MDSTPIALNLAKKLKEIVSTAPNDSTALAYHLFGIIYGKALRDNKISPISVLELAELPTSYQVEINKGINLSRHVQILNDTLWFKV